MKVFNMDVAGYIRRLRAMKHEIMNSNSAKLPHVNPHDLKRIQAHLASLAMYAAYAVGEELDLPKWSPSEIDLGESLGYSHVTNHSILDILTLVDALETELVGSQSARQSSGLLSHDELRLDAIADKINALIDSFIAESTNLDLPANS